MAIKLKNVSGNIDLTSSSGKVIRGVDGGYYTPVIDDEGNLSWIASLEDMNDVAAVNIMGPEGKPGVPGEDGAKGEPGVYVGTEEPTDDEMLIWINPEGGASTELATKEYVDEAIKSVPGADLTGYATEQYVTDAIAAIDIPETDLTNYYTKEEVDNKIPNLEGYALKTDIPDVTAFQTEEQVNALIAASIGEIENGTY